VREQAQLMLQVRLTILWEPVPLTKNSRMARRSLLSTNLSTSTHFLHLSRPRLFNLPQRMEPMRSRRLGLPPISLLMMRLEPQILLRKKESKINRYRLTMRLMLDLLDLSRNCNLNLLPNV
jgi:hypothetical protein